MNARLALCVALSAALPCTAYGQMELRPVDRATVRLIAFTGVVGARDANGAIRLGLRAAHGSGVYVHRDGWIATAGHVVDHADYLVVVHPGEDRGRPAEVVYVSGEHDLALIRVRSRAPHHLPLGRGGRLTLGQTIDGSGYPLDPRERWPAAVSGQVGRPLNDGRIQLSISVNPGNSGGPVVTRDGTLVGILSQGANPAAGAQGIAIMEPIAPLIARLRRLRRSGAASLPEESAEADILLEQLQARALPATDARVTRLSVLTTSSHVSAAIFAVEAVDLQFRLLQDAGVSVELQLEPAQRSRYQQVREIAVRWAGQGVRADNDNYAALAQIGGEATAAVQMAAAAPAAPAVTGPATGPSDWAPRVIVEEELPPVVAFSLEARTGLLIDDGANAESPGGGVLGLAAGFRLFIGHSPYLRTALTMGASIDVGGWRGATAVAVLADLGYRFEIGSRDLAVVLSAGYTPGWTDASARETATAIGYRVGLGVQLGDLEVALSWREIHRGSGTPLRALLLTTTLELIP